MTPQIALTLAIIFGALIIFGTEKLRVDVVALLVLLTIGLTRLVGPEEVFAVVSSEHASLPLYVSLRAPPVNL